MFASRTAATYGGPRAAALHHRRASAAAHRRARSCRNCACRSRSSGRDCASDRDCAPRALQKQPAEYSPARLAIPGPQGKLGRRPPHDVTSGWVLREACGRFIRWLWYPEQTGRTSGLHPVVNAKALDRIQSRTYSSGARTADGGTVTTPNETYSYDPAGRPASTTSSVFGSETWSYDANGNVTDVQEPPGGGVTSPAHLTYPYFRDGKKQSLSVASSGFNAPNALSYSYRTDGLMASEVNSAYYGATWSAPPGDSLRIASPTIRKRGRTTQPVSWRHTRSAPAASTMATTPKAARRQSITRPSTSAPRSIPVSAAPATSR